jgi:hypothetical protein
MVLRGADNQREQERRGRVHVEGQDQSQETNCRQVGKKDLSRRDGQRNQIRIVTAIGEYAVPAPYRHHAGYGHGKNDEEIFVRKRGRKRIEVVLASHPLQQCGVFSNNKIE